MIEKNTIGCIFMAEKHINDELQSEKNPPLCKLSGSKLGIRNGVVQPNGECPFTRAQYGCKDYSLKPASLAFREMIRPVKCVVLTDARGMQITV